AGADLGVLAVDVVDAVAEVEQEADRVEVLPDEVGGVEVEAVRGPVPDRLQRPHGRRVVVGDLAGVDLVREPDADLVEDVEDRVPAFGEVGVAAFHHLVGRRREHGDGVPDRGAGEADDGVDAEFRGGAGRVHDLGGGAAADALRFAVAPAPLREDRLVAFVGAVAYGLGYEVGGDGPQR